MTILSWNYQTKLTAFILFNRTLLKRTLIPLHCRCSCWCYSYVTSTFWCRNCSRADAEGVSDDNDDYSGKFAGEPVKCPDKNEMLQIIKTLQIFSLFLHKRDRIQSYASRIESQVDQHFTKKNKNKKQTSIRDSLNKK